MILLEHLPDESLASLLARLARVNGYTDYCDLVSLLFPGRRATTFIDTEFSFPAFSMAVGNAYGSVRRVIEELTNFNARVQLGEIDWSESRDIENGKLVPRLDDLTFFGRTVLSFCPTCVEKDLAEYGSSYWHRLHQLSVMVCCPAHGDALSRFICKRSGLYQFFPLPGDDLVQMNAHETTAYALQPFWFEIAALAEKLFGDRSEAFDPCTICEVLHDELHLKGLITATGRLRPIAFDAAFKSSHPHSPAEFNEPTLDLVLNPKLMLRGLTDSRESLPFSRVMLIHWLFGDLSAFKERCHWRSILGKPMETATGQRVLSDLNRKGPLSDDLKRRAEHRQTCINYIIENANPSRLGFLKTHYRAFRWLLHHDRSWLDTQLPIPPRQVIQLQLFA